jgi:hypothetical protein
MAYPTGIAGEGINFGFHVFDFATLNRWGG